MWKNMWTRLMNIFKAKANATLDDMENPIQMYKLAITEFESNMKKSELSISKLMAQLTLRKKDLEQFQLESIQRKEQAKQAVMQKRDDLAQTALELKGSADNKVKEYILLVQSLETQVSNLRKDHDRNKKKLKETQTKYDIYKAKYETSLVQKEIASSMSELGGSTALSNLSNYEKQIEQISAEAGALDEMVNVSGRLDNELETIAIDAQIIDEMDDLRIEAEMEQKIKEEQKIAKKMKLLFPKEIEAPKINPLLELPQSTERKPEELFKNHFDGKSTEEDNKKKIDNFFNDKK